jgi:hypothetical protein
MAGDEDMVRAVGQPPPAEDPVAVGIWRGVARRLADADQAVLASCRAAMAGAPTWSRSTAPARSPSSRSSPAAPTS